MARKVDLVIVCEDILHETFMRAFLYRRGYTRHDLTFRKPSPGKGDAKQGAGALFCSELEAIRRFASPGCGLIVVLDADNLSVCERKRWIDAACSSGNLEPPQQEEPVSTVIPKWEIENWLAYLRDGTSNERSNDYYKYQNCESKIYPLVEGLADKCAGHQDLANAPPSLIVACKVYDRFEQWRKTLD